MTGSLTLNGDPTTTNMAATKHYVDANAITDAPNDGFAYGRQSASWGKVVPLAGGTMTGLLTLSADPTANLGAATKQYADTKAPINNAALTGNPTAPTQTAGDNSTRLATTAFVSGALSGSGYAPIASPTFTGDPKAPTAAVDDNDTSIATTAFLQGQGATATPLMNGTAAAGTSTRWAHGDHVHPTDTTRAPLASPSFTGTVTIGGAFVLSGVATPAALSANTNNWNPTGLGSNTVFRVSATASVNVTGLVAQAAGSSLVLINTGTYPITLTNLDSNSSSANQFNLGANVSLGASQAIQLWYDGTSSQWRPKAGSGSGSSGGASVTISDTAPVAPSPGNLWWNSTSGHLFIYYNDGTSSQWVMAEPMPDMSQYVTLYAQDTKPTAPNVNSLWLNTTNGQLFWLYNDGNSTQWIYIAGGAPQATTAYVLGGRFQYLDATHCQLIPFKGDAIRIQGTIYSIPSAGVSIGIPATNGTVYYCYAYMSSGVMTLEWSLTTHVTDTAAGNVGTEIKSGDNSRTLVGMAILNASNQFVQTGAVRNVRSWMNRQSAALTGAPLGSNTAIGSSPSVITGVCGFVAWATDQILITTNLCAFSAASPILTAYCSIDTAIIGNPGVINMDASSRVLPCANPTYAGPIAEGYHTAGAILSINTASATAYSTCTMSMQLTE
jgi:hypothetical protein